MSLTIRDLPRAQWEALRVACFDRDDWVCVEAGNEWEWCTGTEELQADHIRPITVYPELALDLDNLQTLCGPCNRRKSDTDESSTERQPWLNLAYLELRDIVFSERDTAARSLAAPTHTEDQE